jgi:hypothetical protein
MRVRVRVLVSKLSEWVWAVSLLACSLKIRAARATRVHDNQDSGEG